MYSYIKRLHLPVFHSSARLRKLSLKKGCNNGVHVCLKSVKELKMLLFSTVKTTFYGLYSSFFTLGLPLCKVSLKKNKTFVDLSRRVKPFVYVF